MPWLSVTLRYHGAVVEQRLCAVTDELVLGDLPEAAVSFPGCRLRVRRLGQRLQVAGRWLDVGQRLEVCKPPISIEIEAVAPRPQAPTWDWVPDVRLLIATGAVVLIGAWFETAHRLVEANPAAVTQVQTTLQGWAVLGTPVDRDPRVTVAQPTHQLTSHEARSPEPADAHAAGDGPAARVGRPAPAQYEGRRPAPEPLLDEQGDDLRWPPAVFVTLE